MRDPAVIRLRKSDLNLPTLPDWLKPGRHLGELGKSGLSCHRRRRLRATAVMVTQKAQSWTEQDIRNDLSRLAEPISPSIETGALDNECL